MRPSEMRLGISCKSSHEWLADDSLEIQSLVSLKNKKK